ncbi:C2 (Calcium/lipid-binding, CaLB) [Coniochaeta hoffmannii]|uniref:C2 (Calcium/lipid-binding, CaLB) n=1 Tax=Coniochaeta hoffmannii TaxID=91930 RepID=A0AA38R865_9PEZI|nr:C2 (Calcium/lipid-binding, CaLB) [Coniochaeta hoffmannii]
MSDIEEEASRRSYGKPYTSKHPVPTIHGYKERKNKIEQQEQEANVAISGDEGGQDDQGPSKPKKAYGAVKAIAKGEDQEDDGKAPYPSSSRNDPGRSLRQDRADENDDKSSVQSVPGMDVQDHADDTNKKDDKKQQKSASEAAASHLDPKQKRKDMKKIKRHGGGREVTDPVTHLPVMMRDMTDRDLTNAPENEAAAGTHHRNKTGAADKSGGELGAEHDEMDKGYGGMRKLFPPPDFEDTKNEMARVYRIAIGAGLGIISSVGLLGLVVISWLQSGHDQARPNWFVADGQGHKASWSWMWITLTLGITGAVAAGVVYVITSWLSKKVESIFDDETWDADRNEENKTVESDAELPESTAWLNSLLASVWPLINPDLFSSLTDMLEDVMQASLPKVVRMVSVDDMGQGSEAFRILGIRWLPTGAAGQSVDAKGNLKSSKGNDRAAPGEGQIEDGEKNDDAQKSDEEKNDTNAQEEEAMREGMEAEEGDFVNLELAFAYRARSSGKSIQSKAKNAHLYLKFYLPGGIAVPVWVELKGMIGIMRVRLQLTPDPPFFDLCTMTFLGQPRANLSCVPLSKHSLNLMDVPLISSFVQSSIDAALAEYVAPKSLTLNLKDMLVGDDFKKDTSARGVVMVHIKSARDFKDGDGGVGPMQGSSDSYVTVSWGKFGKPMASTRIIVDEQHPVWNEWAFVLVTSEEINADETLRLQLWDSDKYTADDDLGRVEVTLKELMHGSATKNNMHDREDDLRAEDPDEKMPGSLAWSVGYFEKAHIRQRQLDQQTVDPEIRSLDALKKKVAEQAEWKLREADTDKDQKKELHQQTVQDFKERENEMIISAPPPEDLRSGVVSVQIHNITGLETAKLNKAKSGKGGGEDREDEAEQSDELPDSYCTVILNHQKIYRTRTKPKNAKPFFNAGTERFVRDWKTAELIVSVRDSREHEEDPLLGIVYLPLRRVFEKRSQVMETYPLAGGIGYGRARISLVWRSVELQLPKELAGWDYGTVEVKVPVRLKQQDSDSLGGCRIKLQTKLGRVKLKPDGGGEWKPKKPTEHGSVFLGVTKRYAQPLVLEFRKSSLGPDSSPAFGVFWLSDVPDEEEKTVTLKVWKGGKENMKRARNCYDYRGMEEGEQPIGEIDLTIKFWRGLSGYHKSYANKAKNSVVKDVMEVLDTIADEKMGVDAAEGEEDSDDSDSSDSSSSKSDYEKLYGSDGGGGGGEKKSSQEDVQKKKMLRKAGNDSSSSDSDEEHKNPVAKVKDRVLSGDKDGSEDGSRGLRAQLQDYKQHHKSLHRKHRGVMQWKGARTLDWVANKAKHGKGKVEGIFEHRDKEQGIETEV